MGPKEKEVWELGSLSLILPMDDLTPEKGAHI